MYSSVPMNASSAYFEGCSLGCTEANGSVFRLPLPVFVEVERSVITLAFVCEIKSGMHPSTADPLADWREPFTTFTRCSAESKQVCCFANSKSSMPFLIFSFCNIILICALFLALAVFWGRALSRDDRWNPAAVRR